ncbi:uncharacterized protein ANIA_11560 [Aspergillus nidulans FGSC A4]|uniref:Uncharacterized protein n=1 Tax=Emericella nidulans (strain FGSC A4 / ATCC 38163 / CBS 112.46 / NRRL 194 / M139) TaxID=227321 RepID=C8VCC3_EMENI|nr:hypothetical protein [Aspergillus nidulans FGSC A4]CBF78417.1 TPA: hypothetical protein ANIA_11560 [Aspergillus nidulans FGSC A4]
MDRHPFRPAHLHVISRMLVERRGDARAGLEFENDIKTVKASSAFKVDLELPRFMGILRRRLRLLNLAERAS